jgi:chromosome segregation ATPase
MTQSEQHQLAGEASRLLKEDQDEKALAILDRLAEMLPDHVDIQATRAFCLGRLDRFDEAYTLLGHIEILSNSPRIRQTRDFLDARKALVLHGTTDPEPKKTTQILYPVLDSTSDSKAELSRKLQLLQENIEREFAEYRERDEDAQRTMQHIQKQMQTKEAALQKAYVKNVDLETLLAELGQEVSDLQQNNFQAGSSQLHVLEWDESVEQLSNAEAEIDRLTELVNERDKTLTQVFRKNADLERQRAESPQQAEDSAPIESTEDSQEVVDAVPENVVPESGLEPGQPKWALEEVERLRALIQERDQMLIDVHQQMEMLEERLTAMPEPRVVQIPEGETSELATDAALAESQSTVESLESKLTSAEAQITAHDQDTSAELERTSRETGKLREDLKNAEAGLKEAREARDTVYRETSEWEAKIRAAEEATAEQERLIGVERTLSKELQTLIAQQQREKRELENERDSVGLERDKLSAELEDSSKQVDAAKQEEADSWAQQLESAITEKEPALQELEQLRDQLSSLETSRPETLPDADSEASTNESLISAEREKLTAQLEHLQSRLIAADSRWAWAVAHSAIIEKKLRDEKFIGESSEALNQRLASANTRYGRMRLRATRYWTRDTVTRPSVNRSMPN